MEVADIDDDRFLRFSDDGLCQAAGGRETGSPRGRRAFLAAAIIHADDVLA